jgi:hypothetical protein
MAMCFSTQYAHYPKKPFASGSRGGFIFLCTIAENGRTD